jgi:hypothetical protein
MARKTKTERNRDAVVKAIVGSVGCDDAVADRLVIDLLLAGFKVAALTKRDREKLAADVEARSAAQE